MSTPNVEIGPSNASNILLSSERLRHGWKWIVRLDGMPHTITLNHSKQGMTTTLDVDCETVWKHGDLTTLLYSADIPLQVANHAVAIAIRDAWIGSKYSLLIDEVLIDGIDPKLRCVEDDKKRNQLFAALFTMFVTAPVLVFVAGSEWQVGPIRCDYLGIGLFVLAVFALLKRLAGT